MREGVSSPMVRLFVLGRVKIMIKPDGQVIPFTEEFFPYATDGQYFKTVALPDGELSQQQHQRYWLDRPIVLVQDNLVFINNNGELITAPLPRDFGVKSKTEYTYTLTPCGDLYFMYYAYDQLGNRSDVKTLRVDSPGDTTQFDGDPIEDWLISMQYICGWCTMSESFYYLPTSDKTFFTNNDVNRVNRTFK